jgi:hypothetical protein
MGRLYGLDCVPAYACFSDNLRATIRGISFPVSSSFIKCPQIWAALDASLHTIVFFSRFGLTPQNQRKAEMASSRSPTFPLEGLQFETAPKRYISAL